MTVIFFRYSFRNVCVFFHCALVALSFQPRYASWDSGNRLETPGWRVNDQVPAVIYGCQVLLLAVTPVALHGSSSPTTGRYFPSLNISSGVRTLGSHRNSELFSEIFLGSRITSRHQKKQLFLYLFLRPCLSFSLMVVRSLHFITLLSLSRKSSTYLRTLKYL